MKPEKQRIAIAEYCGWDFDPQETKEWGSRGRWVKSSTGNLGFNHSIPDYLNSLDAMHEAEKSFRDAPELWEIYFEHLKIICDDANDPITATATQRAEAFLRTVGRWEE
jgi:hypothetical protein